MMKTACNAALATILVVTLSLALVKTAIASPVDSVPALPNRLIYPGGRLPRLVMPDGSRRLIASLLRISTQMRFGDYRWDEQAVPNGPLWVRVDLSRQLLSVFRGGNEIGTSVILYGSDGKPTPTGNFRILERAARHHSATYDAEMPYMLRLTNDGVAIHASLVRAGYATHGCIGVPLGFARLLFNVMRRGDPVYILE